MKQEYVAAGFIVVVVILTLLGLGFLTRPTAVQSTPEPSSQTLGSDAYNSASPELGTEQENMATPPSMQIDKLKTYQAVLTTDDGDITIDFDTTNTPITSNNFISLAKQGFYNNTIFHRVIPGFMIQGGDPEGTGMGGPGYQFDDEYLEGKYTRGTVAMANAGPNTNGSQFFIMHADYALSNDYVIFGHVSSGMEVVDKIATAETKPIGEHSTPVTPVHIKSVEIVEK